MPDTVSKLESTSTPESQDKTIAQAMMHHNELKAYAKTKGQLKKDGTIDKMWLEEMAGKDDMIGKRARLSITLDEMKNLSSEKMIGE